MYNGVAFESAPGAACTATRRRDPAERRLVDPATGLRGDPATRLCGDPAVRGRGCAAIRRSGGAPGDLPALAGGQTLLSSESSPLPAQHLAALTPDPRHPNWALNPTARTGFPESEGADAVSKVGRVARGR